MPSEMHQPKRLRIAAIGDSITARWSNTNATGTGYFAQGYMSWLHFLAGGAFSCSPEWNFGISGDKSAGVLARVPDALAVKPDIVFLAVGTNDIGGKIEFSQITDNLAATVAAFRARGIFIVGVPVRPRDWHRAGHPHADVVDRCQPMTVRLNAWMAQYASEQTGLVISDPWNAWADPATGLPLSDITEDGTHPSSIGAFAEARVHLQTLAQLLDADRRGPSVGNLLPNGLMFGVDGRRGKGIAGEVADRFAVTTSQATNSGGIVCSKEARASGGEWQVICLDQRAGGHEAVTLEQVLEYDAGTYAPDDRIEMSADIEVSASSGLAGVSARLIEYAGEGLSPYAAFDMVPNATVAGPSSAYVGTAATPPLTIRTPGDSGSRRLACRVMIHGIADGCSCIVKVGALTVRKAHEA